MIAKTREWAILALALPLLVAGCKGFWNPISSTTTFSLTNSGAITLTSPGATTGNTATITVTPASSFSGTVDLTCNVTTSPSGATSPVTCSLSPTSVAVSGSTAQTATLTASSTSTTTTGTYEITVTGTSGSASTTTSVCVTVGSSSGNCSTASTSGNFYVLNSGTSQIAGYYVNAGALTALSGSPYNAPPGSLSMAIAPNGNFLYVGSENGIYVYTIAADGALTLGNSSQPVSGDQAISMQVSPDSSWLVEISASAPYVHALSISATTGVNRSTLVQSANLPSADVQQVAISPDELYVFVAMGTGGTAYIPFSSGNTNPFGAVNTIGLANSGGAALSVAVDPESSPRLFYIGETVATSGSNSGGLRVFNFSTFKEISGSPIATGGTAPAFIFPDYTGAYVYVANSHVSGSSTGVIAGYSIVSSGATYTATALGSTFSAGTTPVGLAEDKTHTFVLAVDSGGSPDLEAYTFDPTNAGYLDSSISKPTGSDPVQANAIVAAP
jgi:6-phosphogluconolactonase